MEKENEYELENIASVDTDENKHFLSLAPQNSSRALEKVDSITKVIDGAVRLALQRTVGVDWVNMGGKWYLQASGVEKIRSVFGLYFRDRKIVKEDFQDGSYAYICSGTAGSKLLDSLYGETTIEVEGMRSSKDGFFSGKDGNKTPDPMDVRKSAYANFTVRAAKALLGFGNYATEDLLKMGVKINQSAKVEYQKGAEGGGNTALISEAQRKRLFAICKTSGLGEAPLKAYLQKNFKIDSTSKILRSDYEVICSFAEKGELPEIQTDRNPGEDA